MREKKNLPHFIYWKAKMFSKGEGKDLGHMAVNTQRLVGKGWDAQEGGYKREQETENNLNVLYTFIKLSKSKVNYLSLKTTRQ